MDDQTFAIIGAGMAVHRELGCGFHERMYRQPLMIEFAARHVPFKPEVYFPIDYKGHRLALAYRVDFVCFDAILVEMKALPLIGPAEHSQVINYLKASKLQRALILNFGARSFQFKRVVCGLVDDPVRR